jgi:hypothetical protein
MRGAYGKIPLDDADDDYLRREVRQQQVEPLKSPQHNC